MANFNENGILIANFIIYTIFFVSIVIILSEIINITKFCYNYTYNYNYGQLNEKTCLSDDTTSIIEYEKARYRIYSKINNYKLQNDLFNKNWINYIAYLSILILTIIICIGFGILFKYYFITGDDSCFITNDKKDYSVLKLIALCFFKDYINFIPNCTMNYFMIFIIIIIYPLIFISKVAFKIDYTWTGGYWTKMSHIIFFILLLYYTVVLFKLNKTAIKEEKTSRLVVYLSYVIIFFIANFVFNKTFDEYNQPDKMSNIYDTDENKKRNSTDVSPNDKNDTAFFDTYKQTAPAKPNALPEPPKDNDGNDLLTTFKYYLKVEENKKEIMIKTVFNSIKKYQILKKSRNDATPDSIVDKYEPKINEYYTNNRKTINVNKENEAGELIYSVLGKDVTWRGDVSIFAIITGASAEYSLLKLNNKNTDLAAIYIKYAKKTIGENRFFSGGGDWVMDANNGREITTSSYIEAFDKYETNLEKVNNYYKAKKDYEDELEIYNKKYNNYKNSQIDFPKLIYILYDIFPKMVGLDKPIVIMIIIAIISFIIIYALINYINDSDRHGIYLYNTILIYLIGILTIFVISNSVLTYNTYFNKYLIYEPISQYKNDINKLNTIFNIALDNNQKSIKGKNDFYKLTTGEKDIIPITSSDTAEVDVDKIIKEIEKDNTLTNATKATTGATPALVVFNSVVIPATGTFSPTPTGENDVLKLNTYKTAATEANKIAAKIAAKISIIRYALYRVLYSASIDVSLANKTLTAASDYRIYFTDTTTSKYTSLYIGYTNFFNQDFNKYYENSVASPTYDIIAIVGEVDTIKRNALSSTASISSKLDIDTKVKTFFLMIKKTFINDVSKINDRIKKIKDNLKYSLYNDDEMAKIYIFFTPSDTIESNFYTKFLLSENITEEQLAKQDLNKPVTDNEIIKQYKKSLVAIDDIFNIYAKYLIEFRKIVISLLNSIGYCEDTPSIDINQKMKEYYRKVFKKTDKQSDDEYLAFVFKDKVTEPLIEIYKSVLVNKMNEANDLFVKYFNIIKFLTIYTITGNEENTNQKNIIGEIINNYNVFNKDNKKYTSGELLYKEFKLQCNYSNKYNKFLLKDKTEQEMNMNNVSWSFVILIIIFAVILIEPTLI